MKMLPILYALALSCLSISWLHSRNLPSSPLPPISPTEHTALISAIVTIRGQVFDAKGDPLPGVNVRLKNLPATGTATDENGRFSLDLPEAEGVLVFSLIGFREKEVDIGGRLLLEVTLEADEETLPEVVVIGYGAQKRGDLTGAISSISPKKFEGQGVVRLDDILQGRAAGVQVINTAGVPGGDVKIRIRGANSILGNNNPLYVVDGVIGADFSSLHPGDIESVEVLKDASATAVYGNRGANGVVLVNTKRGKAAGGKPEVVFSAQVGGSRVLKKHDLLDASSFAEVANARAVAVGLSPTFSESEIQGFRANGGTDWQDEIFRRGWSQQYQLGVGGGNEATRFYLSGSTLQQEGILLNTGYRRYSLLANFDQKISEKINLKLSFAGHKKEFHNNFNDITRTSPLGQALAWSPTVPVRDASGNYTLKDPVSSIFQNPVALALEREGRYNSSEAVMNAGATWNVVRDLDFEVSFGGRYVSVDDKFFSGPAITDNNPSAYRNSIELSTWQQINQLTYHRLFQERHQFTATAIFEQSAMVNEGFSTTANGLQFPDLSFYNISLTGQVSSSARYAREALRSWVGRIQYGYLGRYLLSGVMRADGSSKFREGNRYGYFPAIGLGWVASEEAFMKNIRAINFLKIRASWGKTGNQAIAPYSTLNLWKSDPFSAWNTFNPSSATPGIILGAPGNPDLRWEETTQSNLGLDFELWNRRLSFSFDVFQKNTTGLLIPESVPEYAGGGFIVRNAGEVKNQGVELMLEAEPVRSATFGWSSSFNVSFVKNKIVSLAGKEQIFTGSNYGAGLSTAPEFVLTPGGSMGDIWGLRYLGVWQSAEAAQAAAFGAVPGDARYQDLNGDSAITNNDMQIIGNGLPNTYWGWNNTLTFKRLSLHIFLQGMSGFDKLNLGYAASIASSADAREATQADILDRWQAGSNEDSDIPGFSASNQNFVQSSRFVEHGDFIRVKNIALSYSFPEVIAGFPEVEVFVSGGNLFTFTRYKGIDPETSNAGSNSDIDQSVDYGSYPNSKTLVFGVKGRF